MRRFTPTNISIITNNNKFFSSSTKLTNSLRFFTRPQHSPSTASPISLHQQDPIPTHIFSTSTTTKTTENNTTTNNNSTTTTTTTK